MVEHGPIKVASFHNEKFENGNELKPTPTHGIHGSKADYNTQPKAYYTSCICIGAFLATGIAMMRGTRRIKKQMRILIELCTSRRLGFSGNIEHIDMVGIKYQCYNGRECGGQSEPRRGQVSNKKMMDESTSVQAS
ncbi:hypothetical protein CC80DRAFT_569162 [Byssothecium circinans]|uniref:Uncharacterized protein n=1 Tax=Byssothecium circinans TaxID=147558 RepID=A0A6A5TMV0_9PLEO|nr:hypothetical protein CC80DRAFT_569162 [Byssothecium circinans]